MTLCMHGTAQRANKSSACVPFCKCYIYFVPFVKLFLQRTTKDYIGMHWLKETRQKNTGNMADHKGGLTIRVCLFLQTLDPINKACLMV